MAPRIDDVMRLCSEISAHEQIKVAVKNSTKGALVAGGTAFVGGLMGGPAGIAVGKNESSTDKLTDSSLYFLKYTGDHTPMKMYNIICLILPIAPPKSYTLDLDLS